MIRILLFIIVVITACNNNSEPKLNNNPDTSLQSVWPNEDSKEFLDECIQNAKGRFSEDSAFMYCKCVLQQIQNKFPNLDSASASLIDSSKAAEFISKCD